MTTFTAADALKALVSGAIDGQQISATRVSVRTEHGEISIPAALLEPTAPPEPAPGIYMLGSRLAIRPPNDRTENHWMILDEDLEGMDWWTYPNLWRAHGRPGVTFVPLAPQPAAVEPITLPLYITDHGGQTVKIERLTGCHEGGVGKLATRDPDDNESVFLHPTAAQWRQIANAAAQLATEGGA